jgi:hypothetical protein
MATFFFFFESLDKKFIKRKKNKAPMPGRKGPKQGALKITFCLVKALKT